METDTEIEREGHTTEREGAPGRQRLRGHGLEVNNGDMLP
jgi:hypothetical protein